MKIKTSSFAAVATVLLALALVFVAPAAAENGVNCAGGDGCNHIAEHNELHFSDVGTAIIAAAESNDDKVVTIINDFTTDMSLGLEGRYPEPSITSLNGVIIQGSPGLSLTKSIIVNNGPVKTFENMVFQNLNFTNGAYIQFPNSVTKIDNVTFKNCKFTGTDVAISIKLKNTIECKDLKFISNEISGSGIGIKLFGSGTASGTLTIDNNIIESTESQGIQITWGTENLEITNNKITADRPFNLAGTTSGELTFTNNWIYFPATFVESDFTKPEDGTMPGKAIYNFAGFLSLETGNDKNRFYIGTPETNNEVVSFVELMKHLYPEKTGVIIVDGVGSTESGYSGGYLSVGETGSTETYVASGYVAVLIGETKEQEAYTDGDSKGQWKSDRVMKHYIIGAGAESNSDMKLTAGTFVTDPTAFVAEGCDITEENGLYVISVKPNTVLPETPDVTTETDTETGVTTITPGSDTTITKTGYNEATISTNDNNAVSIVISNVNIGGEDSTTLDSLSISQDAEITANYAESEADGEEGTTVTLSLKIQKVNESVPVIDTSIDEDILGDNQPEHTVLAMITALGDDVNDNIKTGDYAITIKFKVPASAVTDKNMLRAYHVVNGVPEQLSNPLVSGPDNDGFYTITIYGKHFSSYVLVEEEPTYTESGSSSGSSSSKDTGSGNYQYYPRDVPTNGIVDFGTSKVVTGMELPAGSSGKVTLNTKPTFAMPENGFYAFEIDAPGYNLEAKINGGLSFQIPVADLEAAGFTAKDIVLYHGTVAEDGTINWEALPTNLVKNENGIAYYKSAINGCSPFYIGFVKDGSIVNTEVVDPVTPPTETPDVPGTELPEIPDVQDEPEEPSSPAPLAAVIAALGAAVVLRRK